MFFNSIDEILNIAKKSQTTIFVLPKNTEVNIKNAIILAPEEKSIITIEQVREIIGRLSVKQTADQFIIINPADKLGAESANALLKNLEEPKEKVHFILITSSPSELLPTILSRASIYFLKTTGSLDKDLDADPKIRELAKKLITAKPKDLVPLAEEITKKKDEVRKYTLSILATAIEMLYKSYFKTKNQAFIKKIPAFLTAYENIEHNGHIKLHLVADLI